MATGISLENLAGRAAFTTRQAGRVALYMGHSYLMRRIRARVAKPGNRPRTDLPVPSQRRLFNDMRKLFERDMANVEAGLYPLPRDRDGPLLRQIVRTRAFYEDIPKVVRRREARGHAEVRAQVPENRPDYYLQNFHFQTGGWLSEDSARLYDLQVEVFFGGTANAMRRQLLAFLARYLRGRDQRGMRLVDLGCGTGRFLDLASEAFPRLACTGIDLSGTYLAEASRQLRRRPRVSLVLGKAEQVPLPDASLDCVSAVFLFHELPPKIRRQVMREVARILKPGGRFFLLDTIQLGDVPAYDGLLDMFPQHLHEPYYAGYIREDLGKLAGTVGLRLVEEEPAFMSKSTLFEKP